MDKARKQHLAEIERLKIALEKTKSPHLKKDYTKAIKRKERELKQYDFFHKG